MQMAGHFYNGLTASEKEFYNLYKANDGGFAYNLNNSLRGSKDLAPFQKAISNLDSMILKNQITQEATLYRATVRQCIQPFIQNNIYTNPDYLSTATSLEAVVGHFTDPKDPALAKFVCSPGMFIAPLDDNELFGQSEDEMLIGRNNSFILENFEIIDDEERIENIMGKFHARGVTTLYYYSFRSQ